MRKTIKHKSYSIEEKIKLVKLNTEENYRMIDICRKYDIGKGRPKKTIIDFDSMSKKQLIVYINVTNDIKKSLAYLNQQKKNIK